MSVLIANIVRQTIHHARRMSRDRRYHWPTARAALTAILEDLEARSPGDPSLEQLRRFIEAGDRAASRRTDDTQ